MNPVSFGPVVWHLQWIYKPWIWNASKFHVFLLKTDLTINIFFSLDVIIIFIYARVSRCWSISTHECLYIDMLRGNLFLLLHSQLIIFRSFLCNDLIKWVEMPVRLLTFSAFSISYLISGPSALKFHMLILEMGPHNRSGPDFAISEGYPKEFISYAVEALSMANSLVLSLQIIY